MKEGGETMRLWAIHSQAAWEKIQASGGLSGDGRRAWRDFRPAYGWLRQQMTRRIDGYDGKYPVWAWPQKPDLRRTMYAQGSTPSVRLEFLAVRSQVLVSDFAAWHQVLSNSFCAYDKQEWDAYYQMRDDAQGRQDEEDLQILEMEKRASWERIFEPDLLAKYPEWHGETRLLQATLGRVALEQVCNVEYFVARKAAWE